MARQHAIQHLLLTDNEGVYQRLRVDVGQTGFFAGREFRTFHEFSLAAGASRVFKFTCPVNSILESLQLNLVVGEIRMEARTGGTPGGSFDTALPILPANYMTTASGYTPVATVATGGTHTGGEVRDVSRAIAGNNQSQARLDVLEAESPVGRSATDLYLVCSNPGQNTCDAIIKLRWEERP